MHEKDILACVKCANVYASLSHAKRLQVGCVIFDRNIRSIISVGYNGTPVGADNRCESVDFLTIPSVLHAEINAIAKLSWWQRHFGDLVLFVTHSPCAECARGIVRVRGIKEVKFLHHYRSTDGLRILRDNGVKALRLITLGSQ